MIILAIVAICSGTSTRHLKTLAEQELAVKEEAVSQMAVADAWYDASEKAAADKVEMKAYQERAAKWYATALPGLSGLSKIKAEKRIGAVGGLTPTAPAAADKTKNAQLAVGAFGQGTRHTFQWWNLEWRNAGRIQDLRSGHLQGRRRL